MADNTYQPLVYMKQGSTELVVASSGLVTVESGGAIALEDGGAMTLASGASLTVASGGKIAYPATGCTSSSIGSSALTTLPADGLSVVMTTAAAGQRLLYLAAPYPGASKYIHFIDGSTATVVYIDTQTAGATIIQSTGTGSTMGLIVWEGTTNDAPPAMIHLMGLSTSKWVALEMHPATGFTFASTSS